MDIKSKYFSESGMGQKKNPKGVYILLGFWSIFIFVPCIIIYSIIKEEGGFNPSVFIILGIPIILLIFGIVCFVFTINLRIRNNRLYEHFTNGTILEKKATITKFKYFDNRSSNDMHGECGYYIIANIGKQKFKSEKIKVLIFGAEGEDIDKAFYEKKGIPYSPKDPKYTTDFKKQAEAKTKEIEAELVGKNTELEQASWFKKNKIRKEIDKLHKELIWTSPKWLPYKGKMYYIGDEITVYVAPENPKIYLM